MEKKEFIPLCEQKASRAEFNNALHEYFMEKVLPLYEQNFFHENNTPTVYFTAGLPGAGKSRLKALWSDSHESLCATVDLDDLRGYLPYMDMLLDQDEASASALSQKDAAHLVMHLRNYLQEHKISYIFDSSFRNCNSVKIELAKANNAGFNSRVGFISASIYEAFQGVCQRYVAQKRAFGTGRFVAPALIEEGYLAMGDSITLANSLCDELVVYDRQGEVLFNSHTDSDLDLKTIVLSGNARFLESDKASLESFMEEWRAIISEMKELCAPELILVEAQRAYESLALEIDPTYRSAKIQELTEIAHAVHEIEST